jgi:hypothetical protein
MNKILLISEDYVKTNSALNDNVWGKFLLPAIREAQDINLQIYLGECLYKTILGMVGNGSITASTNEAYKALLDDYIQPFLLYQIQANIVPILNVKMANIGTVVSKDDYINTLSQGNIDLVQSDFQHKADFYAQRMLDFMLNHVSEFNLDECACRQLHAHLNSAASCGIWTGGPRGVHDWNNNKRFNHS